MIASKVIELKSSKAIKLESAKRRQKNILLAVSIPDSVFDYEEYKNTPSLWRMTKQYIKFVNDSGPYYWFITLTFGIRFRFEICCKYVNHFIRRCNISYYGDKYYKKGVWIEGFVFFEDHPMETSINQTHVHMLIKPSYGFMDFSFEQNLEKISKAAAKVTDNKIRVFNDDHIDIQRADNKYKHTYMFKQINDASLYRVKMIGVRGLSDNSCSLNIF
jgi:hypothetical protein